MTRHTNLFRAVADSATPCFDGRNRHRPKLSRTLLGILSIVFALPSCATTSVWDGASSQEGEYYVDRTHTAPGGATQFSTATYDKQSSAIIVGIMTFPFTLAWDVATFPFQLAFDYPPYGGDGD